VAAFEAAGIQFIPSQEHVTGCGVAFRWDVSQNDDKKKTVEKAKKSTDGMEAHTWDDGFEDFATDQFAAPYIISISDDDRAVLRQSFAECPDAWNKLSDRAKAIYRRELNI
jgi:hypothetical protein